MTDAQQNKTAYPATRIFVFGQEVTEDILSCSVNWADDTRAPSTAEFTLANYDDRYILGAKDIEALYSDIDFTDSNITTPVYAHLPEGPLDGGLNAFKSKIGITPELIEDLQSSQANPESLAKLQEVFIKYRSEFGPENLEPFIRKRVAAVIRDPIKLRVALAKFDKYYPSGPATLATLSGRVDSFLANARVARALTGEAHRYPFYEGGCLFHSNDPVRIFWRDPYNPQVWLHMFAGFVSDWGESLDVNNVKTVTIRCEDVLRTMRYARIATNPGLSDEKALKQSEDVALRSMYNEAFHGYTLTEFIYTLFFGPVPPGTLNITPNLSAAFQSELEKDATADGEVHGVEGSSTLKLNRLGVGAFNFERSATFVYGPRSVGSGDRSTTQAIQDREVELSVNQLRLYQAIVDHRVYPSDLNTMLAKGVKKPSIASLVKDAAGVPLAEEVVTTLGKNPHLYPVDGGRVIILAPGSLGPNVNKKIFDAGVRNSPAVTTTWSTRLKMLYDLTERLEMSVFASPRGDVLIEMPMYDFDPGDFGDVDQQVMPAELGNFFSRAGGSIIDTLGKGALSGSSEVRGPFAPHYRIPIRDTITHSRGFNENAIKTQIVGGWNLIENHVDLGTQDQIWQAPHVVTLRALVPQFGVRATETEPTTFIASKDAAEMYAHMTLNKENGEVLTSQIDALPNLYLWPNRPLHVADRNYIATVRSLGHTLDWDGRDMSMTVGTNFTRVWHGLYETPTDGPNAGTKVPVYATIGGLGGRVLNYAIFFGRRLVNRANIEREGQLPPAAGGSVRIL